MPVDGVNASCRAWRLPCQLSPYFSSRSSTAAAEKLFEDMEVNLVFYEDFREQGFQLVEVLGNNVGGSAFRIIHSNLLQNGLLSSQLGAGGVALRLQTLQFHVHFYQAGKLLLLTGHRPQILDLTVESQVFSQSRRAVRSHRLRSWDQKIASYARGLQRLQPVYPTLVDPI